MSRRTLSLSLTLAAIAIAPAALHAQNRSPLADRVTVSAAFGGLSGAANLNSAGTADWRLGWAGSLDASYWILPRVGVWIGGGLAPNNPPPRGLSGRGAVKKVSPGRRPLPPHPLAQGTTPRRPPVRRGGG